MVPPRRLFCMGGLGGATANMLLLIPELSFGGACLLRLLVLPVALPMPGSSRRRARSAWEREGVPRQRRRLLEERGSPRLRTERHQENGFPVPGGI